MDPAAIAAARLVLCDFVLFLKNLLGGNIFIGARLSLFKSKTTWKLDFIHLF